MVPAIKASASPLLSRPLAPEYVTCPRCEGTGKTLQGSFVHPGDTVRKGCAICGATGQLAPSQEDLMAYVTAATVYMDQLEAPATTSKSAVEWWITERVNELPHPDFTSSPEALKERIFTIVEEAWAAALASRRDVDSGWNDGVRAALKAAAELGLPCDHSAEWQGHQNMIDACLTAILSKVKEFPDAPQTPVRS